VGDFVIKDMWMIFGYDFYLLYLVEIFLMVIKEQNFGVLC
jgi:hypothetical protein